MYEFKVEILQNDIDMAIELLNMNEIYQHFYEPKIKVVRVKNGYDYKEVETDTLDLKIFAEDTLVDDLPQSYLQLIAEALKIKKEEITIRKVEDSNWEPDFQDLDLGNGWIICYSEKNRNNYSNKNVLNFEPQAAFGTGLHETTQNCLRVILSKNLEGQSVLDLGTGSGLLTVAAALKKAKLVTAIDYQPVRREVMHNIKLNSIVSKIDVIQADLLHSDNFITEKYDFVIINIGADETIQILNRHNSLLEKSSNFLISGIVEWNKEEVIKKFESNGFEVVTEIQTNEWVTFQFQKL